MGFLVKLDTNGTNPEMLKQLIEKKLVDYIAMDIKSSLDKYKYVCSIEKNKLLQILQQSIDYIINSNIQYEFRTTVVPEIVEIDDIKKIVDLIKGAKKYILTQFRSKNTLNPEWESIPPYPITVLEEMKVIVESKGIECKIRGGYN